METVPVAVGRFSFVQIFLGFFASVGGEESCDCGWGGGGLLSCDCAAADKPAKRVKATGSGSERGTKPPVWQGRGRYSLKPILGGKISWVGGIGSRLVQLGMPEFLLDSGERFLGGTDVAVVRVESTLMDGEAGKQFAAVEVILRKTDEPQPGLKFIALLHKVAALVDYSQKQADGNVIGGFAFAAGTCARSFVVPNETVHFGEYGGQARCGFQERVWLHFVFGKRAVSARLTAD